MINRSWRGSFSALFSALFFSFFVYGPIIDKNVFYDDSLDNRIEEKLSFFFFLGNLHSSLSKLPSRWLYYRYPLWFFLSLLILLYSYSFPTACHFVHRRNPDLSPPFLQVWKVEEVSGSSKVPRPEKLADFQGSETARLKFHPLR